MYQISLIFVSGDILFFRDVLGLSCFIIRVGVYAMSLCLIYILAILRVCFHALQATVMGYKMLLLVFVCLCLFFCARMYEQRAARESDGRQRSNCWRRCEKKDSLLME